MVLSEELTIPLLYKVFSDALSTFLPSLIPLASDPVFIGHPGLDSSGRDAFHHQGLAPKFNKISR